MVILMAIRLNFLFKYVKNEEIDRKKPRVLTEVHESAKDFGLDQSVVGRVFNALYQMCISKQFTKGGIIYAS